ncbi:MAG TPA: alkaline phosphatase D family protein [Phycisphaerae bacterium]|nr:alkaline phosphatase D family protein [Phycisphaerae bacterium]
MGTRSDSPIRLTLHLVILGMTAATSQWAMATSPADPPLPNGVAAGDVTSDSAVLWARASAMGDLVFRWELQDGSDAEEQMVSVSDIALPAKVDIENLQAGTRYFYRATDAAGVTAIGNFKTAGEGSRAGLRFGVSGDWRGDLSPYPAVKNAPLRDLDLFIGLGDTIYADVPSPAVPTGQARTLAEFRSKHDEVYSSRNGLNALADLRSSTAVLVMIDDHEVTNDFAGAAPASADARFGEESGLINETALFETGLQAFHEYNPIREEFYGDTGEARFAGKRKLYRERVYGLDAAFFMLDARSFRDEPLEDVGVLAPPDAVDAFNAASFDPARTMLGAVQLDDLKANLLEAKSAGVTWKFVLVPEPIQNLGPILAADRFEGYAYERSQVLRFVDENEIDNVVFIAADIHGTIVNNLTYQTHAGGPQIATTAFEVTTGAVAYAPPFGPLVTSFVNPITLGPAAILFQLGYGTSPRPLRDGIVDATAGLLLGVYGLDGVGLRGSGIEFREEIGGPVAVHTFGWTEFEIDAETQCLGVMTWGIDWYSEADLALDADGVARRQPRIVSQFVVAPQGSEVRNCAAPTAEQPPLFDCGIGIGPVFALAVIGFLAAAAGIRPKVMGRGIAVRYARYRAFR